MSLIAHAILWSGRQMIDFLVTKSMWGPLCLSKFIKIEQQ